ncbi:MAG: hypothetical protein ACOYK6_01630 [Chthoniobacterales bacterium]
MIKAIPKSYDPATESATIGFRMAERDEENSNSENNIPLDILNRIKAHRVGWSSAELYALSIACKNIYHCCLPEKITKNYKCTIPDFTPEELNEMRETGTLNIQQPIYEDHYFDYEFYSEPTYQDGKFFYKYPMRSPELDISRIIGHKTYTIDNEVTRAIQAGKNPGETIVHTVELNSRDYYFMRTGFVPIIEENLGWAVGALEVPKQLLFGGIAGLVIGAGCEYTGKYLGEGIGYLAGGTKGAALGEHIGEDVGAVAGIILPWVVFL